jgi:hypothetical protein
MQVVKVSSLTGKVLEASNYFIQSQGHALLVPILKTGSEREEEAPVKAQTLSTAVNSSNFSLSKEDQERETDQEKARAAGLKSKGQGHDNRRLITFDSTDPEFDEDSDPDADLDI